MPRWRIRRLIFEFWQAPVFLCVTSRPAMSSPGAATRRTMSIVQSGEVEIRLGNRVLETLPQYSIFGERALIDSAPRSATAIASSDAKLVPVSEKQFSVSDQQYVLFRAQCNARYGAASARGEHRLVIKTMAGRGFAE